jgi:hypothetical protein
MRWHLRGLTYSPRKLCAGREQHRQRRRTLDLARVDLRQRFLQGLLLLNLPKLACLLPSESPCPGPLILLRRGRASRPLSFVIEAYSPRPYMGFVPACLAGSNPCLTSAIRVEKRAFLFIPRGTPCTPLRRQETAHSPAFMHASPFEGFFLEAAELCKSGPLQPQRSASLMDQWGMGNQRRQKPPGRRPCPRRLLYVPMPSELYCHSPNSCLELVAVRTLRETRE